MGAAAVDTSRLEDSGAILNTAIDCFGGCMATCNEAGAVCVWQAGSRTEELWREISRWHTAAGSPELVAWAHPAHGRILAVADTSGEVSVWEGTASGSSSPGSADAVQFLAKPTLRDSRDPITCMEFGPREQGLHLAVASKDGNVRLYVATSPLMPEAFELEGSFLPAAQGCCTCLAWRPGLSGPTPPLLAVGTCFGAQIWAYDIEVMDWVRVSTMSGSSAATSAIAWAQPLGRPMELLALAIGSQVDIMGLTGHVDHLKVMPIAKLNAKGAVWHLQWDPLGMQLATSSDTCQVHLWKPNMLGEWVAMGKVMGGTFAHEPEGNLSDRD